MIPGNLQNFTWGTPSGRGRGGAKHSPPGAKVSKARGPPLCISGDPLSQVIICQMMIKLRIQISDYNDF